MKRIFTLLSLMLAFAFGVQAQNGTVTGRVVDENGLGLPGANVFIESLSIGAPSDVDGDYVLFNVPAGQHSLTISFIGYQMVQQSITVPDGAAIEVNIKMEPGAQVGDAILVLGDRLKGQAKALNKQRAKLNVTNVVAADQIGRFPDANIGESLRRVPGIAVQNDQGEARDIVLRGLARQLNSVMLNGDRVPSAEGDNRNIQLDLIPSDMIQTIEVNKTLTPDMDADAIGGSVNLVTRAAPNGLRVSGTAASGFNFIRNNPTFIGNIVLGNRFFDNKVGVVLGASYNNQDYGSDNFEGEWTEDDGQIFMEEFDIRRYDVQRIRRSFSASVDYKINPSNSLTFRTIYNWRDDWENRFRFRVTDVEADGNGGFVGAIERQTKGGIGSDRVDFRRLEDQRVYNASLMGEHIIANKVELTWMASYARASEDRPNERYIGYIVEDIPISVDVSNPETPLLGALNAADVAPSNFELDELTEENRFTRERNYNARIDLKIPLTAFSQPGFIKFGGRYRRLEKL
ncbi:MAG: carboxypeptidase-like regulatory domain-containing protein, partial [Bacteroidota bacterium]